MFKQRSNLPLVTLDKLFHRWLSLEAEVTNYGPAKYSRPEIKKRKSIARDGFQGALPGAVATDSCEVVPDVSGVLAPWG